MGTNTDDLSSDEELMMKYQNGDYSSFEILYNRHSKRVFGYLRKSAAQNIAEELLQETFLKMHRAKNQYTNTYPFLPWLFTIAKNTLFDFYKKSESKIASSSFTDDEMLDRISTSPASSDDPYDISTALRNLPDQQKRAIELRYLSDWSFEQIAQELETSPTNARQMVSRGIKQIRLLFGRKEDPNEL